MLIPSLVSLLSGSATRKHLFCILKVIDHTWEIYHQHSSPYVSPNQSNNKIRFSFSQPCRKKRSVRLVDVIKNLSHRVFFIVTLSLEEWPTKAEETPSPSPHEIRLALLGTNSVFQCLGINTCLIQLPLYLAKLNQNQFEK